MPNDFTPVSSLRLGSRASTMARWQALHVKKLLEERFPQLTVEVKFISTAGDKIRGSLKSLGGKGAFVRRLDEALINFEVDLVVNCMKDIPHDSERGVEVEIGGCLKRDSVNDILICRLGEDTQKELRVGTSSPRREALLRRNFPNWQIEPVRGNVDTRINKVDSGYLDGVVLAKAGLERLGLLERITEEFSTITFPPALGQGILTLDCRLGDDKTKSLVREITDPATYACLQAERALLNTLQGSCFSAIAGQATLNESGLTLIASVFSLDGKEEIFFNDHVQDIKKAQLLGERVGRELLNKGAKRLLI
jgi:hydroxymethylbilane synthase